jgi:large-conductance mechanosensitive channel
MTPIPYQQAAPPGLWDVFSHDPFLLITLLPFAFLGVILWLRVRAWRRINSMSARNQSIIQESSARTEERWAESAARQQRHFEENIARMERYQAETAERTERMIALLAEIRDLLARAGEG